MSQLGIAARPKTLNGLIGQEKLVRSLRGHAKKAMPKAWLFHGPRGLGKTTVARIIALSLQCVHQEEFGEPCLACRKKSDSYPIYEINAADTNGVDAVRDFIAGAEYAILGAGKKKVYILDECHELSSRAQNLLLKHFESKKTRDVVWIICSTEPEAIIPTLRSRCITYALKPLSGDELEKLVKRLLKKVGSDLSPDELIEALITKQVDSPRLVCNAVDKFIACEDVEEASSVDGATDIDTKHLCRSLVKGEWTEIADLLRQSPRSDAKALKAAVVGYLSTILWEHSEYDKTGVAISEAITRLSYLSRAEDQVQMAALGAELYNLARIFSNHRL